MAPAHHVSKAVWARPAFTLAGQPDRAAPGGAHEPVHRSGGAGRADRGAIADNGVMVEETPADLVLTGGAVYTVDAARSWAQAVAITAGRITAVGSVAGLRPFVGPRTEVVSLRGRMVLPGFQDAHVHASGGGLELGRCDLSPIAQPGGLPGRHPRLRRPQPRSGLDHRRRVVDGRVPRRGAQQGGSRRHRAGPAGVPVQPRPPRCLGELPGARAGRPGRHHPRPPGRPHRAGRRRGSPAACCTRVR